MAINFARLKIFEKSKEMIEHENCVKLVCVGIEGMRSLDLIMPIQYILCIGSACFMLHEIYSDSI